MRVVNGDNNIVLSVPGANGAHEIGVESQFLLDKATVCPFKGGWHLATTDVQIQLRADTIATKFGWSFPIVQLAYHLLINSA